MRPSEPPQQDLVLVGGGHAHALVLRKLAMARPASLRVTLISSAVFTPYSGMLPGLLAGHYTFEDTHIDLLRLCQWAGVRFLDDTVSGLDPQARRLSCNKRGALGYELLSIDIGCEPELDSVPGAREYATPVKPVAGLWRRWAALAADPARRGRRIAVVGGGAGSVELALAMAHRLRENPPQISLYCGAAQILPGYSRAARRGVTRQLAALGVALYRDHRVAEVSAGTLHFGQGQRRGFDTLIWATGAGAAPWIKDSGLPVDARGFMTTHDTLQSTGFANVFGAGDIATQCRHPRPKAGVYAVRQGPVLAANLLACATGRRLREHRPQRRFLSLLALGPKRAVAERGGLSAQGAWVWRWKDRIDRRFMRQFHDLPPRMARWPSGPRRPRARQRENEQAPCGGCGAKISADALREVLNELGQRYPEHIPPAMQRDDAACLEAQAHLMQSVDGLRALIDDPWRMGRIAAQHALSDLYACAATPHSALPLLTLAFSASALQRRDLRLIMQGALSVFVPAGCRILGGHSMQGPELQIAFAVNGRANHKRTLSKRGAQAGDVLILTKALGSGALFAAHMQHQACGRDIETALAQMEAGNGAAAAVALSAGARAATDVSGFGFAGHLAEMLGDTLTARLELNALPALPGAVEAMRQGVFSTLHEANRNALEGRIATSAAEGAVEDLRRELLFDPQTSGGLLLAVPPDAADTALNELCARGVAAALVGNISGEISGKISGNIKGEIKRTNTGRVTPGAAGRAQIVLA